MKKIFTKGCCLRQFVLSLLAMVSSVVYGYDFEVDGLCYNILYDNEVEITYKNGDTTVGNYSGIVEVPEFVTYNNVVYHVKGIGTSAFNTCVDLTGPLTIPNTITYISDWAFKYCSGLTGPLTIPNSVTLIGDCAFKGCTGFTSLTLPNSITHIWGDTFNGCSGLTGQLTIPNSVTYIGDGAFYGCIGFSGELIIPPSVYRIGSDAFSFCRGLTGSLSIPSSVTYLDNGAFMGCSGITSLTIPNSECNISHNVFRNCSALEHVYSKLTNPYSISEWVFEGISPNATLHIPQGTKELYQQYSGWTKHFSNIVDDLENTDPQLTTYSLSITAIGNGYASYDLEIIRASTKTYTINEGKSVTVGFSPDSGYRIKSLKVNGANVSASSNYTISINSDTSIEVEFEEIPVDPSPTPTPMSYTLSIKASGYGSANYGGEVIREATKTYSVNEGTSASISFTPDDGYNIQRVIVNGSDIGTSNTYSTTVNANTIVEVVFEAIPVTTYTLTVIASGNGVATIDGTDVRDGSQNFTVNEGSDAIVSFTPDKGYIVEEVKVDGSEVEVAELYTISDITSDKTIEVAFAEMDRNFSIDGVSYLIESFEDNTVTLTGVQNTITLEVSVKVNYQAQEWNVIGISENALDNSEELAAIIWDIQIPFTAKVANPNLLLYVKDESYAPAGIRNVVVNGFAKTITLTDAQSGNNFYCPSAFITQSIIYTHNYSMKTGINESKGWETIALPFDVQKINNNRNEIIPFVKWSTESNSKPFWLYELKGSGFVEANGIKANTPYIISMPNNDLYEYDYNLSGEVTFSALNAEVKKSDEIIVQSFGDKTFVPNYLQKAANEGYYVLNVNNDYITDESGGNEGSRFILNLRKIHPFESYMTSSSNARSFEVFDGMKTAIRGIKENAILQKKVKVYDVSGKLLKVGTSLDAIKQDLPAGVYIVNNQKLIIK